jgi:hypothetical protein
MNKPETQPETPPALFNLPPVTREEMVAIESALSGAVMLHMEQAFDRQLTDPGWSVDLRTRARWLRALRDYLSKHTEQYKPQTERTIP